MNKICPMCGESEFELHADLYFHMNRCTERRGTDPQGGNMIQGQRCPYCNWGDQKTQSDLYLHMQRCAKKPKSVAPVTQKALEKVAKKAESKGPRPCLCPCGGYVNSKRGNFLPGHDAKLKSLIQKDIKGEAPAKGVTPSAWAYAKAHWSHLIPELLEDDRA